MDNLFSLIICTLNREELLKKCVDSLLNQTYKNFEIIIIDQSDNRATCFDNIENITYVHIKERGLSNARNVAIPLCNGEWIALIDDDAVYKSDYLEQAVDFITLHRNKLGIISGVGYDRDNKMYLISSMKRKEIIKVSWSTLFKYCMSAGMIINSTLLKKIGFDNQFGVGSGTMYGAGEESDIVIYALNNHYHVYFIPYMIFYHRADINISDEKNYLYNMGKGALLKKHFLTESKVLFFFLFICSIFRSCVGCLLYFVGFKNNKKSLVALKGKVMGFVKYNKSN